MSPVTPARRWDPRLIALRERSASISTGVASDDTKLEHGLDDIDSFRFADDDFLIPTPMAVFEELARGGGYDMAAAVSAEQAGGIPIF